jgi:hypothetical protein
MGFRRRPRRSPRFNGLAKGARPHPVVRPAPHPDSRQRICAVHELGENRCRFRASPASMRRNTESTPTPVSPGWGAHPADRRSGVSTMLALRDAPAISRQCPTASALCARLLVRLRAERAVCARDRALEMGGEPNDLIVRCDVLDRDDRKRSLTQASPVGTSATRVEQVGRAFWATRVRCRSPWPSIGSARPPLSGAPAMVQVFCADRACSCDRRRLATGYVRRPPKARTFRAR